MATESTLAGRAAAPGERPLEDPAGQTLLEVSNLTVDFPSDDGPVHAVRGVSYRLGPREVLGIVGESGSGKSVTSLAVMGLLPKQARIGGSVKRIRAESTQPR